VSKVEPITIAPPPRNGVPILPAIAAVLVFSALVGLLWGVSAPLHLTVDGVRRTVAAGATVEQLNGAGYVMSDAGDLLGVKGGVVRHGAGDPITYVRNGAPVGAEQHLYDGDVILSTSGVSRREPVVRVKVSVAPTTTVEGTGPILKLMSSGKPGVDEVTRGQVSGAVISSRTITPAVNMVIAAVMPSSTDKIVALTFDDGPWPNQTDKILEILKTENVPGTFFMLGIQAKRNPALAARVAQQGELVGNHTYDHALLTKMKFGQIQGDIAKGADAIRSATGTTTVWFRPPYGAVNKNVWAAAKGAKESLVLWDVDSLDWTRPGPPKIVSNVMRHVGQASIVLMHDGGGDRSQTIAALPKIIGELRTRGYTFVTVEQMEAAR
jgi:peptidoglycan/xylan/chitin deacetylase (PgdA/CDA1 family)